MNNLKDLILKRINFYFCANNILEHCFSLKNIYFHFWILLFHFSQNFENTIKRKKIFLKFILKNFTADFLNIDKRCFKIEINFHSKIVTCYKLYKFVTPEESLIINIEPL